MTRQIRSATAAAMLLAAAQTAPAQAGPQDYPQWRGRDRDGAASAFAAPKAWPQALTLKWKVDVGAGYATPIVVGSRVYAFARKDANEVMLALDAATGKTIWQASYAAPYKMSPMTKSHGEGPKATPTFANGRLFTLGISGIVSAFDASNGKILWQTAAPPVDPLYGTSMSPVVDRNTVIVHVGGNDNGALTAFDVESGTVKWAWKGDGPAYGSPVVVDIAGTRQVITATQKFVVGVDVASGALLWSMPFVGQYTDNSITPNVLGDVIIISPGTKSPLAFRPIKRGAAWTTETVWENTDVTIKMTNPVIIKDVLYGLSTKNSGQYFALDARTGKTLWLGSPREAQNTAIVKAGDLLFLLNEDAELIVARGTGSSLEPLQKYTVAESATWAQPAIIGNRMFVKDVSTLALWAF